MSTARFNASKPRGNYMKTFLGFLVCVVALLMATGPVSAGGDRKYAACYPENESVICRNETGSTWASGKAEGKVEEVESEYFSEDPALVKDRGPASIELSFNAKIKGNNTGPTTTGDTSTVEGNLDVKIEWKDRGKAGVEETVFETGCAQEIETDRQASLSVGEFEGEFEGSVKDFPGYPGTKKAAVASLVVKEDPDHKGKLEVDIAIELGYTSFENVGGSGGTTRGTDDIELDKIVLTNQNPGNFKINNDGLHGRWNFLPFITPTCTAAAD
jgi:hypothetical protein